MIILKKVLESIFTQKAFNLLQRGSKDPFKFWGSLTFVCNKKLFMFPEFRQCVVWEVYNQEVNEPGFMFTQGRLSKTIFFNAHF